MKFYCESKEDVLRHVESSEKGLTSEEVLRRQEENGKNLLEKEKGKSIFRRFMEQLIDPMIIILLVAAAISGVLAYLQGESFADVIIILAVVIVNSVLGVYQEGKAEKAIEALQKMSAATSKVIRDGKIKTVKSEDLVVGDVVLLEAGNQVPADGRIIESANLKMEEAALTGESVPVNKFIDILNLEEGKQDIPLGDRENMTYMGSNVVYGRGKAVVTAIGMQTEMGKIAGSLQTAKESKTPLQQKLNQLSHTLTKLIIAICLVVFLVQLIRHGNMNFEFVLNSFMIAVSLAVAAIPEGLVAVVTVVLSIGVTKMSERDAIIRKLTAVETLGCAQVICSDKTGTLTQNKMTVVDKFTADQEKMATAMALCNDAEIDEEGEVTGEPTEAALVTYAYKNKLDKNDLKKEFKRVGEVPFDSKRKMMSTVHSLPDGSGYVQYSKGAPDVLLKKCDTYLDEEGKIQKMNDSVMQKIIEANKSMANDALRVLACGMRYWEDKPEDFVADKLEEKLCFLGICGMIDPIRPEVKDAIAECREAGIKPIMITGDNIDTAIAIGKQLGIIDNPKQAIEGLDLDSMTDEEFMDKFQDISIYARVQPEHKTRVINAWQEHGYVTAMTGDGVNDAPSIKAADIGVGMGITGTDVTKNVADMVLADDNFATIVNAVEEGRRIYDNIRKAIQYLLAANMSEVISIFVATLMGFVILKPVHLLWINLVTDTFPALALGLEQAEPGVMKRDPRSSKDSIFANGMGFDIVYQGIVVSALILISYFIGLYADKGFLAIADSEHGITMAFLTMSMAEIFHSFNMRSRKGSIFKLGHINKPLLIAGLGSLVATTLVCEVPFLVAAFDFTPVGFTEYMIAIILGFLVIPIVELVKLVQRKKDARTN